MIPEKIEDFNEFKMSVRNCNSCTQWTKICKAECCKGFYINTPMASIFKLGDTIKMKQISEPDMVKYYRFHGVNIGHGLVSIKLDNFIRTGPQQIFVYKTCKYLSKDFNCTIHNSDFQPKVCKTPSMETYHTNFKNIIITPNCLFKHKLALEAEDKLKKTVGGFNG